MKDGNYLYRSSPNDWWRACTVRGGKLTGTWRTRPANADEWAAKPGVEFIGPLADDSPDWHDASADCIGRLFREPIAARVHGV